MLSRIKRSFLCVNDFSKGKKVLDRHRIDIDCTYYHPDSLKIKIKDGKLYVSGQEKTCSNKIGNKNSIKKFTETHSLPDNSIPEKISSYFVGGHLIVDVPFKRNKNKQHNNDNLNLYTKIINTNNGKIVMISCKVSQYTDPQKLKISCLNRDLMVRAEYRKEDEKTMSRKHYYFHFCIPENSDLNSVKCDYKMDSLLITAELLNKQNSNIKKPIDMELMNNVIL
jgi:HSP20 family molecular chaperone IbpA